MILTREKRISRLLIYFLSAALLVGSSALIAAKLTDQTTLILPASNDIIHVVDVSDTTSDPAGTSKQSTLENVRALFAANTTQIINKKLDLPAPIAGVISLSANTNYVLGGDVSLGTDRLDVSAGGVSWTSNNIFGPTLTYTGTGTMFTGVDATFNIFDANLDCANCKLFDLSDVAVPGTSIFQMDSVQANNCGEWGTFSNGLSLIINNSNCVTASNGVEVLGSSWIVQSYVKFALISASASFVGIDFGTSVSSNIEIANILFAGPPGAVGVSGAGNSANISTGSIATFRDSTLIGGLTEISGLTSDDIRWAFDLNSGIQDTMPDAMLSLNSNATETVIGTQGVPVKVVGTWVVERASQYTGNTNGRITYDGERPLTTPVDITMIVRAAGGTNKDVTAFLAVNGTIVANSGKPDKVGQNLPKSITIPWQLVMNQTNFLEIFIQNDTDTVNLVVTSAVLRAR